MPSISFTPIVPAAKRADGTFAVKVRLTFKRASRWIPTSISVKAAQLTRGTRKIKDPAVLASLDALVGDLRQTVAGLSPFALDAMDVDDVLSYIKRKKAETSWHLDFFEWGEAYAATLSRVAKAETLMALNAFARFLGAREIDINAISAAMLRDFIAWANAEPKAAYSRHTGETKRTNIPKVPNVAAGKYIWRLRQAYEAARLKYNDEDAGLIVMPRAPFDRVTVPPAIHTGQRNLGPELVQKIIQARPASPAEQWALDLFVLSFGTMGANLADLFAAKPPVDGWWEYERQKTRTRRRDKAKMRVAVNPCLGEVLGRLQDRPGSGRWLRLHRDGSTASAVTGKANYYLKQWAKAEGIEPFTMYAARHSWASIARSAAVGIDKATVDDCLGHRGDRTLADIYIERDFELFANANSRVLSVFQWH